MARISFYQYLLLPRMTIVGRATSSSASSRRWLFVVLAAGAARQPAAYLAPAAAASYPKVTATAALPPPPSVRFEQTKRLIEWATSRGVEGFDFDDESSSSSPSATAALSPENGLHGPRIVAAPHWTCCGQTMLSCQCRTPLGARAGQDLQAGTPVLVRCPECKAADELMAKCPYTCGVPKYDPPPRAGLGWVDAHVYAPDNITVDIYNSYWDTTTTRTRQNLAFREMRPTAALEGAVTLLPPMLRCHARASCADYAVPARARKVHLLSKCVGKPSHYATSIGATS